MSFIKYEYEPTVKKIAVLYHGGNCMDGLVAAWMIWSFWSSVMDRKVDLFACDHGKGVPPLNPYYDQVYIVDFSFKREEMLDLSDRFPYVVILDHHKTAEEELRGISEECKNKNVRCVFDMEHSGAFLAWQEYVILCEAAGRSYGYTECNRDFPPPIVLHVQDRDLWKWEIQDSRQVTDYLHFHCGAKEGILEKFDVLVKTEHLLKNEDGQIREIFEWAYFMHEYKTYCINEAQKKATEPTEMRALLRSYHPEGKNVLIRAVNTDKFISEIGERLSAEEGYDKPPVIGLVYYRGADGMWKCSLRSKGDCDVSEIAKCFGGGGHKNAAGFELKELPF